MTVKDIGYALVGATVKLFESSKKREQLLRIAEYKVRQDREYQNNLAKGRALAHVEKATTLCQQRCNHRKGGHGVAGIIKGMGDDRQYAVIKHRHRNGDTHIRCLRCAKTWTPGAEGYHEALKFPTLNARSTDVLVASVDENGNILPEFAEAWRRWQSIPQYEGVAFNRSVELSTGNEIKKALDKIEELSQVKKPISMLREYVPTYTTDTKFSDNLKFRVSHESNVS